MESLTSIAIGSAPAPGVDIPEAGTGAAPNVALSRGEDPQEVARAIINYPPKPSENGEQYARSVVDETLEKLNRSKRHEVAATAQAYQHTQQLALGVSR